MLSYFHINTNKKPGSRILARILPVLAVLVFSTFFFSAFAPEVSATHNKRCDNNVVQPSSLPCADGSSGEQVEHAAPPPADNIDEPASGSPANTGPNNNGTSIAAQETLRTNFGCGWDAAFSVNAMQGCILEIIQSVIYSGSTVFFSIGGVIFDTFMALSLSSTFIKQEAFVDFGWVLIRDVANTAFIFVLLYIAIMTILRAKSTNTKEMLVALVISALLVNFSLYITRVVIDASNIVALEFYNKIGAGDQTLVRVDGIDAKSVSAGFLISSTAALEEKVNKAFSQVGAKEFTKAAMLLVAGAIFNIAGMFVLLSAGFLFLARVIALWFVMIFSPLAFVAAIIPIGHGLWNQWKSTLFSQSFFAPIFLFFLYLTFAFLKFGFNGQNSPFHFNEQTAGWANTAAASVIEIIVTVFIPFIIAYSVLAFGLNQARKMSGASGAMAEKFGKLGIGAVVGAAAGTAAFAGRNLGGRGIRRLSEREGVQRFQRSLERSGIARFVGADKWIGKAAGASYDVRGLGKLQAGLGAVGGTGFNVGQAGEGHVAALQKEQKLRQDQYNKLKGDPAAQARYFNSLSFRDQQAIHGNLSVSDQLALHEELQRQPGYNDRAWHDLGGSMREKIERVQRKQANLSPKTAMELAIERAKQTKATVDDAGNITESAEDKRLAQLAGITDQLTQRKVLAALSARDVADLHQRAGARGNRSPVSQSVLTGLVSRMGAEDQEKFHSEMIKRESNVAKQAAHLIGITDQTVMQNVFNNMNTDLRSKLFHEGQRAGGATQTALDARVAGLNPAERVRTEQEILKRFTGANADTARATRIAGIAASNAQLGQEIWAGTDVRVRAHALESGAPAVAQLQGLEAALPQTERDRTSDAVVEVKRAKDAIVHRQTIESPASTPAQVIDAMKKLDSKQIARLNSGALANPQVRTILKLNDINAIYDRGEFPTPEVKRLLEEYVTREAPLAAAGDKAKKSQMRSLSRNQKLFDLLEPAVQTTVADAI